MNNFSEIYDFGEHWRDKPNFQVMPVGNFLFTAKVIYKSKVRGIKTAECTTLIVRNGMQDGEINIYENGPNQAETHHLLFSPNWQNYQFDSNDGAIIVTGKSPKMGEYSVRIIPNGIEPSF